MSQPAFHVKESLTMYEIFIPQRPDKIPPVLRALLRDPNLVLTALTHACERLAQEKTWLKAKEESEPLFMSYFLQGYLPSFVEGYAEAHLKFIGLMTNKGMLDNTQIAQALDLDVELVQQVQMLIDPFFPV